MSRKGGQHKRALYIGIAVAVLMFGFGFALVPLYNVFCKVTGLNGKTNNMAEAIASGTDVDKTRVVTVEFVSTNNENLPWSFYPMQEKIQLHPGEMKQVSYFARNDSNRRMTVQAIPSVAPGLAAQYLKKTECFCFTEQTFDAKQSREMPVLFHLDPSIPKDINYITLSYTLFDKAKVHA